MSDFQMPEQTADDRIAFIEDMVSAFEKSNPGVGEVMALYEDAVQRYAIAAQATPNELRSTSSSSTNDLWW